MRRVKFRVSMGLLSDALHLPDDCQVVEVSSKRSVFSEPDVWFEVQIPGEIGREESPEPVEVQPIVTFEPEKYTLDWNLPKKACPHGFNDWDECPDCRH